MLLSNPYVTSLLCILALNAGIAFSAPPADATRALSETRTLPAAREAASSNTTELLGLHKRLQKAATSERAQLREQLIGKAEQRRQLLLELAQSHPEEVLRVAIPEDKQKGMPAEVVAKLEQRLELDGELEVVYEDYEDGPAKLRHFLKTSFGERFELRLAKAQREWRSGLSVRAQGVLLEHTEAGAPIQGDLVVNDDDSGLLLLADGTTSSTGSTGELAYDLPNTLGAQRTLAILVNFQDKPSEKPWTTTQANSLMFGSGGVSGFFKENSSQQTWLTGNVAGWYTIPVNSTICDGFAIEKAAKSAAQAAGFNLANYERFVYIFPKNACGYSGMGQVGAAPSSTWINGSMILRTVAHEMGHNLGLHHAHALDCGDTTLGSSCTSQEYGDTLDIMGYSGTVGHFNGFNKERLGWLASSNIINVASGGNFYLKPNSTQTNSGKVLKIANGLDSSGQPRYYYVEYRQPTGFDAQLTDRGVVDPNNVFKGVAVHQASPSNCNSGQLLDLTAGSNFVDMKDAALVGGRSFSGGGMTLSTQWTDASQALVSVDFGGGSSTPTCTRSAPVVSVSLSPVNPSGWPASLASTSLSLAPGASASTSLKVTSPSTAADGFYSVGSSATANTRTASGTASFVIDNPTSSTNQAPKAVNDSSQLSTITSVNVPVLANDSDPDGDKLNIVAFTQGSKGSVTKNSDGSLKYSPAKSFKSGDQFSYTISDGKSSASATVSIGLSSTTASNGKGKP